MVVMVRLVTQPAGRRASGEVFLLSVVLHLFNVALYQLADFGRVDLTRPVVAHLEQSICVR